MRHQVLASEPDPMFLAYMAEFGVRVPMAAEPYADHALHDDCAEQLWVQEQVFDHPDACTRYAPSMDLYEGARFIDGVVGLYRDGPTGDRIVGVALHRMYKGSRLSRRECMMVKLAVTEMKNLIDRGHLPLASADSPALSPRLRQVLDQLLRGESVKRIARAMSLSVWTVREHVQRLYKRCGVNSREELMAKHIRA
jgi:DNA-binding CsgD family transcriptional regulator